MKNNKKRKMPLFVDMIQVGEIETTGDWEKDIEVGRRFLEKNGYKGTTVIEAMFRQAFSFALIAGHIYEEYLQKLSANAVFGAAPFVVNSTFCIEIYLKTLHRLQGNSVKGHSLAELYDSLSDEHKNMISGAANRYSSQFSLSMPVQFIDFITDLNNCFVDWRYIYEKNRTKEVRIEPTLFMIKVLHEVCHHALKLQQFI